MNINRKYPNVTTYKGYLVRKVAKKYFAFRPGRQEARGYTPLQASSRDGIRRVVNNDRPAPIL